MKVAFVLDRIGYLKWFAPLALELRGRGFEAEFWLNRQDVTQSTKWYESPTEEAIPHKVRAAVGVAVFANDEELAKLNGERAPSVIFSYRLPPFEKRNGQTWCHLATGFHDSYCTHLPAQINRFDLIFTDSVYWGERGLLYYQIAADLPMNSELANSIRTKMIPTGIPQYDHFLLSHKAQNRRALGFPAEAKIVTVYAYEPNATFWSRNIFRENSRMRRFWSWLALPTTRYLFFSRIGLGKLPRLLAYSFADRAVFLPGLFSTPSELELMLGLKEFCRREGALLALKYRKKNPPIKEISELADLTVLGDSEYYPYTSARVISASDLLVTFFSCAAAEAVYAGTPVLNLMPPRMHLFSRGQYELLYRGDSSKRERADEAVFFHVESESMYNYEGVARTYTVGDLLKKLPSLKLADFRFRETARSEYLRKFLDSGGGTISARIVDAILAANLAAAKS